MPFQEARDRLLDAVNERPCLCPDFCAGVRDVVVVASSSRGGSSVFAEILRHSPHLLHFRAEINPFLILAGLGYPESGTGSDRLEARHADVARSVLNPMLAMDAGTPGEGIFEDRGRMIWNLWWRLSLQWPEIRFALSEVEDWYTEARSGGSDPCLFHAAFLARVRQAHPRVNPFYYDLQVDKIRRFCPDLEPEPGPPSRHTLEEPPFVTVGPWTPVRPEVLGRPLIIKTPSNVYRLPFLRALFPNARVRVIHLTRNAAASINGLYDGWRFRGFYAHSLPVPLAMRGYTDVFPAWGTSWWKFDLPPGWEEWTRRPLVDVCGFQWRSSHEAVLDDLEQHPTSTLRLRFEDVVADLDTRHASFGRLCEWLGIPFDPELQRVVDDGLPPIMATDRPRHRRWYDKAELLEPVLQDPAIRATMERMGYAEDPATWL